MMNVKNIKLNSIYKFDNNKYITLRRVYKTANGIRIKNGPKELVFVYEVENGSIIKTISGRIVDKQEVYDINKEFMIVDYDNENPYEYKVTSLEEISLIDSLKLRKMILTNNHSNKIDDGMNWDMVLDSQSSDENYTVDGNDGLNWDEILKSDSGNRKMNHYDNDCINWGLLLDDDGSIKK